MLAGTSTGGEVAAFGAAGGGGGGGGGVAEAGSSGSFMAGGGTDAAGSAGREGLEPSMTALLEGGVMLEESFISGSPGTPLEMAGVFGASAGFGAGGGSTSLVGRPASSHSRRVLLRSSKAAMPGKSLVAAS